MTIKELREFIRDLPDDMPVISYDHMGTFAPAFMSIAPAEMVDGEVEFRAPGEGMETLVIIG